MLDQEHGRRPQDEQVGDQRGDHRERAEPAEQPQRRQVRKHRHDQAAGQHHRGQDQRRADQDRSPFRPRPPPSSSGVFSSRSRLRKWIVALSPRPNETISATTLANCRPSPISHKHRARHHHRENPRQDADQHHDDRAEREADERGDEQQFDRQRGVQLADHVGAVARGDRRQAGHRDLVAGMLLAHLVQRRVELLDHGQNVAGVDVGHAAETTTASSGSAMKRRVR